MRVQLGSWSPRADEARVIAGHLAAAVAEIAPHGVGCRDDVWEAVAELDQAFVAALERWKNTGLEEDKAKLRSAYRALLNGWRGALGMRPTQGAA